jgi:threonine aldolase
MDTVDFRSDTVSWPTPAMREAMAAARVGDDVYGEDPTVNELQEEAAALVGKEAGLLVASGTMGNLVAILSHAGRGDEAILGADAHSMLWEAGGMAVLGGIVPRPLPTDREGRMDLEQVDAAVRADNPHLPHSRLVLVENSYGARGGVPLPPEYFTAIGEVARRHGLSVHLDGARLFNAAVALGRRADDLTPDVDSVTFCLSKGLCAPVGSVLCGSAEFIHQACRIRKIVGGGMRQAGILAAAGLVALREMIPRLQDDHTRAARLADGLAGLPGIRLDRDLVRTNIVYFHLEDVLPLNAAELTRRLKKEFSILLGSDGARTLRAVTHYWIGDAEVDGLVKAIRTIVTEARPAG